MKHRVAVQNKLHDVCVDMCKELGAYPEKCTCPGYTDTTDKTPGVMTWDELLAYMDEVSANGDQGLKGMSAMSALQQKVHVAEVSKACQSNDMKHRVAVQNKLHDVCVDMCKELGAYPERCTCPGYTDTTDKTPGVMTWDELIARMDDVVAYGRQSAKDWKAMSALQQKVHVAEASKACQTEDLKHRMAVQNKLHDVCVDMFKELGAYPEGCTCPDYKDTTDKTPGVMTRDELLTYMAEVAANGRSAIKGWHAAK